MEVDFGLFMISLVAAALPPTYLEVAFAWPLAAGYYSAVLWAWASVGNMLGAAQLTTGTPSAPLPDRSWLPF